LPPCHRVDDGSSRPDADPAARGKPGGLILWRVAINAMTRKLID
jgi:hypothetical protein